MKQIRDAVVIGGGIIGSATAMALTRGGIRRVTLVEKGPLASGMTRRNPGLVHPFYPHPLLCELASAGYDFYSQWGVHLKGKSSFVETGAAVVADFDVRPQFALWTQHTRATEIGHDTIESMSPSLTDTWRAAMFTAHAGYADAALTAQAMVQSGKERGLEIQTGTLAKQILADGRRITGVKTTTGDIEAPAVIVTTGGWTDKLLLPLGIAVRPRFRRGVVVFYEQPQAVVGDLPMLLDANGAYFVRPHPYHMSAAGRVAPDTTSQGTDTVDEFVSTGETASVKQFVTACIPAYANSVPKRMHPILYNTPGDGLPVLGRVQSFDGLYVGAGFGTGAFSVAPAVGELLAQLLIDGTSARDLSVFDPLRAGMRS